VEEVTDEPLYRDRVCGIDIGKAGLAATIRVPSDGNPARRAAETRSFGTTRREVLALADWLRAWQVPAVVMEASGDYWKGPFCRLEAEGFECVLADAKQVKNLPGRPKHDPGDSRWLAACFERGAVTSCFVATPEFRIIRLHTRYAAGPAGTATATSTPCPAKRPAHRPPNRSSRHPRKPGRSATAPPAPARSYAAVTTPSAHAAHHQGS
jgi:Transposase